MNSILRILIRQWKMETGARYIVCVSSALCSPGYFRVLIGLGQLQVQKYIKTRELLNDLCQLKESKDGKEMLRGCCVCSDDQDWKENPLVDCKGPGCNVVVHQGIYSLCVLSLEIFSICTNSSYLSKY